MRISGKRGPYTNLRVIFRLCVKCGTLWPEMFNVPDAEWKHYVEPQMQDKMLCEACYTQIKAWIDGEGLGWRT
jgi:hypothetical protein